jgi:RNA polymerase sigma factor (sigma-70 family)
MDMVRTDEPRDPANRATMMEAIVTDHETALLRYATRILRNPFAAQDVVQNVFIKLFQSWQEGMRPSKQMKSWLYRVTHNEAVDLIRHESRLRDLHERQAGEPSTECPDGEHCEATMEARRETVLKHLHRLHPREQQVVLLRLEEGLSYKEIGEITSRSEGNVGNILHHAVRKLSASLKRAGVV